MVEERRRESQRTQQSFKTSATPKGQSRDTGALNTRRPLQVLRVVDKAGMQNKKKTTLKTKDQNHWASVEGPSFQGIGRVSNNRISPRPLAWTFFQSVEACLTSESLSSPVTSSSYSQRFCCNVLWEQAKVPLSKQQTFLKGPVPVSPRALLPLTLP